MTIKKLLNCREFLKDFNCCLVYCHFHRQRIHINFCWNVNKQVLIYWLIHKFKSLLFGNIKQKLWANCNPSILCVAIIVENHTCFSSTYASYSGNEKRMIWAKVQKARKYSNELKSAWYFIECSSQPDFSYVLSKLNVAYNIVTSK